MYEDFNTGEFKKSDEEDDSESWSYSYPYSRFAYTGKTKSRLGRNHNKQNRSAVNKDESKAKEDNNTNFSSVNSELNSHVEEQSKNQPPKTPSWLQGDGFPASNPFTPGSKLFQYSKSTNDNHTSVNSGIDTSSQSNFFLNLKNDPPQNSCKRNLVFNHIPFKTEENGSTLKDLNKGVKSSIPKPIFSFGSKNENKENYKKETEPSKDVPPFDPTWSQLKKICEAGFTNPLFPQASKSGGQPIAGAKSCFGKNISIDPIRSNPFAPFKFYEQTNEQKKEEDSSTNLPLDLSSGENMMNRNSGSITYGLDKILGQEDPSKVTSDSLTNTVEKANNEESCSDKDDTVKQRDTISSILPKFLVPTNKTVLRESCSSDKVSDSTSSGIVSKHSSIESQQSVPVISTSLPVPYTQQYKNATGSQFSECSTSTYQNGSHPLSNKSDTNSIDKDRICAIQTKTLTQSAREDPLSRLAFKSSSTYKPQSESVSSVEVGTGFNAQRNITNQDQILSKNIEQVNATSLKQQHGNKLSSDSSLNPCQPILVNKEQSANNQISNLCQPLNDQCILSKAEQKEQSVIPDTLVKPFSNVQKQQPFPHLIQNIPIDSSGRKHNLPYQQNNLNNGQLTKPVLSNQAEDPINVPFSSLGSNRHGAGIGELSTLGPNPHSAGIGELSTLGPNRHGAGIGELSTLGPNQHSAGIGELSTLGPNRHSAGIGEPSTLGPNQHGAGIGELSTLGPNQHGAGIGELSTLGPNQHSAGIGELSKQSGIQVHEQIQHKISFNNHNQNKGPSESLLKQSSDQQQIGTSSQQILSDARVPVSLIQTVSTPKRPDFNHQKTYLAPPSYHRVSNNANNFPHLKPEIPQQISRPNISTMKKPQNNLKMSAPRGLMSRANTELCVNNNSYTILSMLGRGGSSEVYQVLDPRSSKLMAVKCVDLSMVDRTIADGYLNEIDLLSKLQGCASVIKMFDYEYSQEDKMLYVVMEKGDTDLSHLIRDISKTAKISMSMIIYYWTEMLTAVRDIHDQGIIHSDLKPANFLLVSGRLKLIDFGIASSQGDMTSVVKEVTTGTWNYMSPEAIRNTSNSGKGFKITYKSDVWSLGCILYNLVYGKTPFSHITNTWGKLQAIADSNHEIEFPNVGAPVVLAQALRSCFHRDPKQRPTVAELLNLQYHASCDTNHIGRQLLAILPPDWWLRVSHLFPDVKASQDSKPSEGTTD